MNLNEKLAKGSTYGLRTTLVEEGDLNSMKYMFQCFVGHEDTFTANATIPGPEAIYTGTFEQPRIMLARTDLPGGPMGDEMWYRLTVGLERKVIQW